MKRLLALGLVLALAAFMPLAHADPPPITALTMQQMKLDKASVPTMTVSAEAFFAVMRQVESPVMPERVPLQSCAVRQHQQKVSGVLAEAFQRQARHWSA